MKPSSFLNYILITIFSIFSLFFLYIEYLNYLTIDTETIRNYFTDSYGILALVAGLIGIINVAPKWKYFQSYLGRSILFFSAGLTFQALGHLSYTIEFYLFNLENTYPSFGEIFFFGSIPLYILGVWYISKSSGSIFSLRSKQNKIISLLIPIILIGISYINFLRDYSFEDTPLLTIFLDFAYPIGQAIYLSFALLSYYLTRNFLGGIMKKKILFILVALIFQYLADSYFIFQNITGTWDAGGLGDYLFILSYFLLGISLIQFNSVFDKLKATPIKQSSNLNNSIQKDEVSVQ